MTDAPPLVEVEVEVEVEVDRLILLGFAVLAVTLTVAGFTTSVSSIWTPQFLIDLAGG